MKIEDITVQVLDEVDEERQASRVRNLLRSEVIKLGYEYAQARLLENRLETQCMLRARKLRMLGFEKLEIGELFGVPRKTINKWLKGMD
jgi:hypothetical protein